MSTAQTDGDLARADLVSIADRINEHHDRIKLVLQEGLDRAVEVGRLLMQAKARLGHGSYLPWLDANFRFNRRTASNYVRVAKHAEQLIAEGTDVSRLGFSETLRMLSDRGTEETPLTLDAAAEMMDSTEAENGAGEINDHLGDLTRIVLDSIEVHGFENFRDAMVEHIPDGEMPEPLKRIFAEGVSSPEDVQAVMVETITATIGGTIS